MSKPKMSHNNTLPRSARSLASLWIPLALGGMLLAAGKVPFDAYSSGDDSGTGEARWWRGNTHTHTLWSDGDAPPNLVAKRYREAGYDFLVLSDHNILSQGERWFPVTAGGRLTPARLAALKSELGQDIITTRVRTEDGVEIEELLLPTLAETRALFEQPDEFMMIEGEEITDGFDGRPVHVNGINLTEKIAPQGGESYLDTVQRNFDAVAEQGARLGRPTLAHLNHPNFQWAVRGSEDFMSLKGEAFVEIYNGHPSTREAGDEDHQSIVDFWDEVNVGRGIIGQPLALGFATDDSHHHHEVAPARASMQRGWVMVRSESLEANAIVNAMRRGDFYGSSGVTLSDLSFTGNSLTVDIDTEEGVTYETTFTGAVKDADGSWQVKTLGTTTADPAVFNASGDELFVRATVTSSRNHPRPQNDPPGAKEVESAWTQPVQPTR